MELEKDEAHKSKIQTVTVFVEHPMRSDSSKDGNGKEHRPRAPQDRHHCREQCEEQSVCKLER